MRTPQQIPDEAAFGLMDETMIAKLRRLLKNYGLMLKSKSRREDDQIYLWVEQINPPALPEPPPPEDYLAPPVRWEPSEPKTIHWRVPRFRGKRAFCGTILSTAMVGSENKANVTCQRCIAFMRLHGHFGVTQ